MVGCSSSSIVKPASSRLSASSFAAGPGDPGAALVKRDVITTPPVSPDARSSAAPDPGVLDVAAFAGAPNLPAPSAPSIPADQGVLLDSLVGQINGNPVYASKFFRDTKLDAALAGMALKHKSDAAWRAEANDAIRKALLDKIRDELVLAEARSSLTPEERKGILYFIGQLRNQLVSGAGGSEAVVNETLLEREGKNLDEKVKEDLETQLVKREVYQRVASKVIVSWKDIQLEYERRFDEFNPPPVATLRMIWLPAGATEQIERVKQDLSGGVPFKDIAARDENEFNSGGAGAAERTIKGSFNQTDFFPQQPLNEAARGLSTGSFTGPIPFDRRVAWISLESVVTPPAKSLYDVQLQLDAEIKKRRFDQETVRYLSKLMNKGSFSDVNDMNAKLLATAEARYLVPNR